MSETRSLRLSAEDLLGGAGATYVVKIPASLLRPEGEGNGSLPAQEAGGEVVLRPLTVRDVQRVVRAAKEQQVLTTALMVQQSLVEPKMTVDQVGGLSAGLLQFLAERVNALSGLGVGEEELERTVRAPMTRACFVLAREFGWTPAQCAELTVGQVLLYLEMIAREDRPEAPP